MDVEVYIAELCCLLLFLVRKDLLWLHFIPGINVISFNSLMVSTSEKKFLICKKRFQGCGNTSK